MIQGLNLSYRVEGRTLVHQVSLGIRPGEILGILGPNGAGKSTLVKLLSGELTPTQGEVRVQGRPIQRWSPRDLARIRGVMTPGTSLVPGLRVGELVSLGRAPHGPSLPRVQEEALLTQILGDHQLLELRNRETQTLSSGEAQRAHFARGVAQLSGEGPHPRYFFLDEPSSALDLSRQLDLLARLQRLAGGGWGILVVLHDLNLAARFCHRLGFLKEGRLIYAGTPSEVLTEPRVTEVYDLPVRVIPHPDFGHPVVLPLG